MLWPSLLTSKDENCIDVVLLKIEINNEIIYSTHTAIDK